jgi:hypothetical protein
MKSKFAKYIFVIFLLISFKYDLHSIESEYTLAVTKNKCTFVTIADNGELALIEFAKNTQVLINNTENYHGYYSVTDIETGAVGILPVSSVKVYLKNKVKTSKSSPIQQTGTTNRVEALVKLINDSEQQISLKIRGIEYKLKPNSSQEVYLQSGRGSYYASATGVESIFGTQEFNSGGAYTWKFWIRTTSTKVKRR